jgi:hypothetical protein
VSRPDPFAQTFNWFTDRHFTLWPLSLLRVPPDRSLDTGRVLGLGALMAAMIVVLVTLLRWVSGREVDGFATVGISVIALLLSWSWFALAALAWNRRARSLHDE